MKELTLIGKVVNGEIEFTSKDYEKKIKSLEKTASGNSISISINVMDTPEHWQHKYFHGMLLPDIAYAQGETDVHYLKNLVLKPLFLTRPIDNYSDIPSRFRERCRPLTKEIGGVECLIGYIPSLGDLTYEEMKSFILNCESLFFEDLQGSLGMSGNTGIALEFRKKAFQMRDFNEVVK
jgi:hypothetical protein